jgi:hypothetical protein
MDDVEPTEKPGCLMPLAWLAVGSFTTCLGIGVVAAAGSQRESDGITAANWAAGPIGFALAGMLAALVVHFAAKTAGVRIAVPFGCGCLGAVGMIGAVTFFFAAIFPAL